MKICIGISGVGRLSGLEDTLRGVLGLHQAGHDVEVLFAHWNNETKVRVSEHTALTKFNKATGIACRYGSLREITKYARAVSVFLGVPGLGEMALCGAGLERNLFILQARKTPLLLVNSGCDLRLFEAPGLSKKLKTLPDGQGIDPTSWHLGGVNHENQVLDDVLNVIAAEAGEGIVSLGYLGNPGFSSGIHGISRGIASFSALMDLPNKILRVSHTKTIANKGYLAPGPMFLLNGKDQGHFLTNDNSPSGGEVVAMGKVVSIPYYMHQPSTLSLEGFDRKISLFDIAQAIDSAEEMLSVKDMTDEEFSQKLVNWSAGSLGRDIKSMASLPSLGSEMDSVLKDASAMVRSLMSMEGISLEDRQRLRTVIFEAGMTMSNWKKIVEASLSMKDKRHHPLDEV